MKQYHGTVSASKGISSENFKRAIDALFRRAQAFRRSKGSSGDALARIVLLELAYYARGKSKIEDGVIVSKAWPTQETIARQTMMAVSTVKKCIKRLEELGAITRATERLSAKRTRNTYSITIALGPPHAVAHSVQETAEPASATPRDRIFTARERLANSTGAIGLTSTFEQRDKVPTMVEARESARHEPDGDARKIMQARELCKAVAPRLNYSKVHELVRKFPSEAIGILDYSRRVDHLARPGFIVGELKRAARGMHFHGEDRTAIFMQTFAAITPNLGLGKAVAS